MVHIVLHVYRINFIVHRVSVVNLVKVGKIIIVHQNNVNVLKIGVGMMLDVLSVIILDILILIWNYVRVVLRIKFMIFLWRFVLLVLVISLSLMEIVVLLVLCHNFGILVCRIVFHVQAIEHTVPRKENVSAAKRTHSLMA